MDENEVEKLSDDIANKLHEFFGDRLGSIGINECSALREVVIDMNFSLYNYFGMGLAVAIGFRCGIEFPHEFLPLVDEKFNERHVDWKHFERILEKLDEEVRLRIPDKYLEAKGWGEPVKMVCERG